MVLPSILDSKEERRDLPKRKYASNTVDHSEGDLSRTSEMSDDTLDVELQNQVVITWIVMSVAVGLFNMFTVIECISRNIMKDSDYDEKTEGQVEQQLKEARDLAKTDIKDCEADSETPQNDVEQSDGKGIYGESEEIKEYILMNSGDDSWNTENTNDISDRLRNVDVNMLGKDVNRISVKCENNDKAAVHIGPGFLGNFRINTEAFSKNMEDTSIQSEATSNDKCCRTTKTSNYRSTATLQDDNLNYLTPVTVNYLQTKYYSCNAETPKAYDAMSDPRKDLNSLAEQKDEFLEEMETSGSNNGPSCSIKCVKTSVKGLSLSMPFVSSDVPPVSSDNMPPLSNNMPPVSSNMSAVSNNVPAVSNDVPPVSNDVPPVLGDVPPVSSDMPPVSSNVPPVFSNVPGQFYSFCEKSKSNFELHCYSDINANQLKIKDKEVQKSQSSLQNVHAENNQSSCQTESRNNMENNVDTVSDSSNLLANYHTPQDTEDGNVLSRSVADTFIFPQDSEKETENRPLNVSRKELNSPTSKFLRNIRGDPEFSKSLDSQIEVLEKGCKLLQTKPLKSSLRTSDSEGSLKKYVHFPADIRNIRTVHKYHSFDESWCGPDVFEDDIKKTREQSFNA